MILLIAIVINLWSRFHKENPEEENVISSATILHKLDEKAQMIESGIVSTQINQMVIGQDKVSYLDDSRFSNDTQYTTFRSGDEENKVEFYMTKDMSYLYKPEEKKWFKYPTVNDDAIDIRETVKDISVILQDPTISQDKEHYILTGTYKGDELSDEQLTQVIHELSSNDNSVDYQNVEFNSIKYEVKIHKDSYYLDEITFTVDMNEIVDDENQRLMQKVHTTYSDFNKIKPIVIPNKVKEQAIEING